MVSARLDYCNSVLYGTSQMNINKLQRVQNMLGRTVVQARKYDHVIPDSCRSTLVATGSQNSLQDSSDDIQRSHYTTAVLLV